MVGEGVLIDLSQMSERAIADTLALLDHLDPSDEVPAIFTHGAFRFGGFIKPTMGRLESAADLAALEPALRDRYGATDAERICSGNALRVLRAGWGRG